MYADGHRIQRWRQRRAVAEHLDRVWNRGRFDRATSPDLTVAIVDGRVPADVFGLHEAIGAIPADTGDAAA